MSKSQLFWFGIGRLLLVLPLIPIIDLLTGDRISRSICDVAYVINKPKVDNKDGFQAVRQLTDADLDAEARKKLSEIILQSTPDGRILVFNPAVQDVGKLFLTASGQYSAKLAFQISTEILSIPYGGELVVPEDLRYLSDKQPYCFNDWWQDFYKGVQFDLTSLILSLLILRVVVPKLYFLILKVFPFLKINLEIEDFNDEAIELKIGKTTAAMVKSSIAQYNSVGETANLNIAIGSPEKFDPNLELDLEPIQTPIKILFQLLQIISLSKTYTISGYLHKSPGKGLGLSLTLKQSNIEIIRKTFWQIDYDYRMELSKTNSSIFEKILADMTAIWTLFKIDGKRAEEWVKIKNWKSYAYSQVGAYWMSVGEYERAKYAIDQALIKDRDNRFALFNLGTIAIRQALILYSQKHDSANIEPLLTKASDLFNQAHQQAIEYEKPLKNRLEQQYNKNSPVNKIKQVFKRFKPLNFDLDKIHTDTVFYKIKYQQCAICLYKLIICSNVEIELCEQCQELIDCIQTTITEIDKGLALEKELADELKEFLKRIKPIIKIMHEEISVRQQSTASPNQMASILSLGESLIENIKKDCQIRLCDPKSEKNYHYPISEEELSLPVLPGLGHYNLACYYSACAKKDKETDPTQSNCQDLWCHLEYALGRDPTLVEWARIDPSLEWLRQRGDIGKQFNRILNKYDRQT